METLGPQPSRQPWGRFLTLLLAMGAMAAILGVLLGLVLSGLPQAAGNSTPAEKAHRSGLVRFAVVCVALLGLTLIVMFWLVVRFLGSRFQAPLEHSRTEHVDAWSLAGKRLKVGEEEGEGWCSALSSRRQAMAPGRSWALTASVTRWASASYAGGAG